MIELSNVSKIYDNDVTGVKELNLTIQDGEFVFLVGESGSGKSTLLKLLMKELDPTEGAITIDGEDVTHLKRKNVSALRRRMGIVFQDYRLLTKKTVYENVAFALEVIEESSRKIRRSVPLALNMVGLAHKSKYLPGEISGGEQQRTAIARAIVNNPPILLADEPTGNLDPKNSKEIIELIERINKRGTTVIIATHDRAIVDTMQKRVIHLEKGEIVRDSEKAGTTMRIRTIKVCLKDGCKGILRNGLMSLASIGTIAACLFILGLTFCIVRNVQQFTNDLGNSLGIVVFLKEERYRGARQKPGGRAECQG
ncbi:MAG: cell division ATP-binding protein FtsE [Clostridia bacterium]